MKETPNSTLEGSNAGKRYQTHLKCSGNCDSYAIYKMNDDTTLPEEKTFKLCQIQKMKTQLSK